MTFPYPMRKLALLALGVAAGCERRPSAGLHPPAESQSGQSPPAGAVAEDEKAPHVDEHGNPEEGGEPSGLRVEITAEAQESLGLQFESLETASLQPSLTAYGEAQADPMQTFTVRAPAAGYLRAGEEWPALGRDVADGSHLADVEPRLSPMEELALLNQRVEAEGAVAEDTAELDAARASFAGKQRLNAEGKMVSDRELDEAQARVRSAEARLDAARRKVDLLGIEQSARARGKGTLPVTAQRGGQVIETLASPGEAVESGQVLLRLARFDPALVRIELPLGEAWQAGESAPLVRPAGTQGSLLEATLLGRAPDAGAHTRGQTWLMRIPNQDDALRPGAPVVAQLPLAGEPLRGVRIPGSAVVRYGGRTWVYLRIEAETFERRDVELTEAPQGWFAASGVRVGEIVVVTGAQMLLSEQLKSQIEAEAEASE